MADIGVNVSGDTLFLWRGRDFKWNFEMLDTSNQPMDFPAGDLYFEFFVGDTEYVWDFDIDGSVATIKVESDDVDLIPARTTWQLVFLPEGELSGGDPVAWGSTAVIGGVR
ncbi:hypothetical protein SEA_ANON_6 [Gordonia phage Anon]|nr:hypothetical protein SEA_ANON_6 [Gordonia phage Anon]